MDEYELKEMKEALQLLLTERFGEGLDDYEKGFLENYFYDNYYKE